MMARTLAGLFFLALAIASGAAMAQAVTVDFESVPTTGCVDQGSLLITQGFNFSGDPSVATCDSTSTSFASNGSNYLVGAAESSFIVLSEGTGAPGTGQPFSFLSFDAASLPVGSPPSGVQVFAFDAESNVIADQTFNFANPPDGPGGAEDFEAFALPPAFSNANIVVFVSTTGIPIALDNLVVVADAEPIPTLNAWGLISLGMLLLTTMAWALRRNPCRRMPADL